MSNFKFELPTDIPRGVMALGFYALRSKKGKRLLAKIKKKLYSKGGDKKC